MGDWNIGKMLGIDDINLNRDDELNLGKRLGLQGGNLDVNQWIEDINKRNQPGTPATDTVAEVPPAVTPEQEDEWAKIVGDYVIPYQGENLNAIPAASIAKTSTQQWVEDMVKDRAAGKGVATLATQLTPENVQNYKTLVEQVMQPNYLKTVNKLNEEWHSYGRSFDSEKLTNVGTLAMQYDSDVAGKVLGMAGSDVDRINLEAGKSLGYGLTIAQMDQASQHLAAGQQFQMNMYKMDVRDKAISGLQNEKVKNYYTRLARAWDNQDWTEYASLAKELAEAGQPDVADYLMSFIANVGSAYAGTKLAG